MDFHLQNVRTGQTHALDPVRTLIGTADHATLRVPEGPYLAALVVRYPGGWVVHGFADDVGVTLNRQPLRIAQRIVPQPFDVFAIGDEMYRFVGPGALRPPVAQPAPTCLAYIRSPDGQEECRTVDHDLLIGRLAACHVRFNDPRLSRLHLLLAAEGGAWYAHNLSKSPIARNRELMPHQTRVEDEDELVVGPLHVRLELRAAAGDPSRAANDQAPASGSKSGKLRTSTDTTSATVETAYPAGPTVPPEMESLHAAAMLLDRFIKSHKPRPETTAKKSGLGGWLDSQREKLSRFWYDTPETTSARGLRAEGRLEEAFGVLDRAIRQRPDSPALLRELYRLYEAAGLTDLCYRPLRQIEKLAELRGAPDAWVLGTLARVCEQLGRQRPSLFDRAVNYWNKLETATGVSYARERDAAMASRTIYEAGLAGRQAAGGSDNFD